MLAEVRVSIFKVDRHCVGSLMLQEALSIDVIPGSVSGKKIFLS